MSKSAVYNLLNGVIAAPSTGDVASLWKDNNTQAKKSVQAIVSGTGAVSATVVIEGANSNVASAWLTLATITLSGTTSANDGFTFDAPWYFVRARVTAISGTDATVSTNMTV